MQLIQVNALQTQSPKATLNRIAKVRGSCIVGPLIRARTVPASLSRNHEASRVGKQRLGNQFLTCMRTVRVRSVDELDIKLHGAAKNRQRGLPVLWGAPDALSRKAHRSETEPMDGQFPAKRNLSS